MKGEKRGIETPMCGCLSHAPTGDLAHNPGICPDWKSNWRPFGSHRLVQNPLSHTSQGHLLFIVNSLSLCFLTCTMDCCLLPLLSVSWSCSLHHMRRVTMKWFYNLESSKHMWNVTHLATSWEAPTSKQGLHRPPLWGAIPAWTVRPGPGRSVAGAPPQWTWTRRSVLFSWRHAFCHLWEPTHFLMVLLEKK